LQTNQKRAKSSPDWNIKKNRKALVQVARPQVAIEKVRFGTGNRGVGHRGAFSVTEFSPGRKIDNEKKKRGREGGKTVSEVKSNGVLEPNEHT